MHDLRDRKKAAGSVVILLFSILFIWPGFAVQNSWAVEIVDRIVAVVNDDIITLNDLNQAVKPYLERIRSGAYASQDEAGMKAKLQEEVLNRLIEEKLTDQEIKRAKIEVDEAEIDAAIRKIKERNFYSDDDFAKALAAEGMTAAEYRTSMKEQILRSRLVNREVKSKTVVTEDDIKAYYESHQEDYGRKMRYHLRNIMMQLPPAAGDAERQAVIKRMEAIRGRLKDGESFADLAKLYSESKLAADGGDLGQFDFKALAPQLQEALKGLNKGDTTPVIETDHGFQIFYVQEIVMIPGKSLAEVSAGIQEKLFGQVVEKRFRQWLEELRKRSHIRIIAD